jgi:hypothetical protein
MEAPKMDTEIFTEEELKANDQQYEYLSKLIASEQALLFVGAGCSVNCGYPASKDLVSLLNKLVPGSLDGEKDLLQKNPCAYIDRIKEKVNEKYGNDGLYKNLLKNTFSPYDGNKKEYEELHKFLLRLPFKGIVTTNYDVVIENAIAKELPEKPEGFTVKHGQEGFIADFFRALDFKSSVKYIAHLHGIYKDPADIILSEKDYVSTYKFKPNAPQISGDIEGRFLTLQARFLWSVFITRRLVFIGFSFDDLFFRELLYYSTLDSWPWGERPHHFAILPISNDKKDEIKAFADDLTSCYGIEVLFYPSHDSNHLELIVLMGKLCKAAGKPLPGKWDQRLNNLMMS